MKPYPQSSMRANLCGLSQPQHVRTSGRASASSLLLLALFLALAPTALASTTWYVNGVSGSDKNNCASPTTACETIGHAISIASWGDSIMVAAATYKENLTVRFSLRIVGSGATTTIIDGGGAGAVVTISTTKAQVTLSRVTVQNGNSPQGGGGINNAGTLAVNNSTISGNNASLVGGGILNDGGTLTINNSTISGNQAWGSTELFAHGGGISNFGTLTINGSTVSRNRVNIGDGGGISNSDLATVTINSSTISGNKASSEGGAIYNTWTLSINNSTISGNHGFYGGAIFGSATLQNSIVANSLSGGNCYGAVTSKGYNLSSDGTCNFNNTGDLNNTDPKLGQLGNYGGPTQTIPLLSASPAIDAGNPGGCTDGEGHLLKTDQRGKPRPDKEDSGGCDMGAYERQKD
jgi:hypothetical protein